jgi:hypothetical protein
VGVSGIGYRRSPRGGSARGGAALFDSANALLPMPVIVLPKPRVELNMAKVEQVFQRGSERLSRHALRGLHGASSS